jgi:ribose/xylose/arabinose/galactoside ABC-type transport system permease subunit
MELRVIAAVIIGGASLKGGEGTVLGAFLGTLLMALITNALNLLGVDVYWQTFVIGATLLTAVLIDTLSRRRQMHSGRRPDRVPDRDRAPTENGADARPTREDSPP